MKKRCFAIKALIGVIATSVVFSLGYLTIRDMYYIEANKETESPTTDSTTDIETNKVQWEYTPLMSSRYPAMSFSFDVSCQKIVATCDNGTLIDYDHWDDTSKSYPQGTSLTIQNTDKLYWTPHDQEEDTVAASAEVTFTVLDENGEVLYEGILVIVRMEETTFGAIYAATLEDGSGLALIQNEDQLGGILI